MVQFTVPEYSPRRAHLRQGRSDIRDNFTAFGPVAECDRTAGSGGVIPRLDDDNANRLMATAVGNVQQDYPIHWTQVVSSADELVPHRKLHPAFAGSFDWHSCVHQTWLIVRLLRLRPE